MKKKFIIVAEDDKAYGLIYKKTLEKAGYEILLVDRGDVLLEKIDLRKPDLLILDLVMPGKTGFMVLDELRKDGNLKSMKIVIASNLSQEMDRKKVKEYGIMDYFIKSDISIEDLVQKIHTIMDA